MPLGWLLTCASVLLNVLVVFYLFRNRAARKKYFAVGLFCLVQLTIIAVDLSFSSSVSHDVYSRIYWTSDLIAHLFITLVIVTLLRAALTEMPQLKWAPFVLFGAIVLVAIFSIYLFRDPRFSRWMNPVSRNLSVAEECLNLVLWGLLLQRRELDPQLLILSFGIGMQVTGEVMGLTLRPYTSPSMMWVPNLLAQASELLCLAIWVWALRSRPTKQSGT